MPGSGQVEQVTVRFQADINQYITSIQLAAKVLREFLVGAEAGTSKAMTASIKGIQQYAKLATSMSVVAVEQAKVAAATDKAAMAHDRLNNQTTKSSTSISNMGSALRGTIGQYLSLGIAISQVANVVKEGMDFNKFMEVSTTAFGVMMKSTDLAKAKMKELFDFAVNSPLTFKDTVSASRQLMAYGFAASELVPTINTLGIVAKATGVQLGDMAYVYGTLRSQGRAYTRDLMQFAMRGIPIYEELAKVVGKPVAELQKMTEAGKIGFKEVEQAFANMTTGTGRFAGFFDEYMKTYEGKMSMLTDIWQQATGKLTKGLFESLKPMIDDLTKFLKENGDQWTILGGRIAETLQYIFKIRDAFIAIGIGLIANQILKILIPAIIALNATLVGTTGLAAALGVVSTALGGWPMLIAGAIAAIVLLLNKIDDVRKAAPKEGSTWSWVEPVRNTKLNETAMGGATTSPFAQRIFSTVSNILPLKVISAEEQAKLDEVANALEKMTDSLKKYQDEWAMIQAKNLVASEKDIYAVANLENELQIKKMNEEFKGQDSLLKKALDIQKLIHADALNKIAEEAEARAQAARERLFIEQQKVYGTAYSQPQIEDILDTAGTLATGENTSLAVDDIQKQIDVMDKLKNTFSQIWETLKLKRDDFIAEGGLIGYETPVEMQEVYDILENINSLLDGLKGKRDVLKGISNLKAATDFAGAQQKSYDEWKVQQGTEMEQLTDKYEKEKKMIETQLAGKEANIVALKDLALKNLKEVYDTEGKLITRNTDLQKYSIMTQGDPAFWERNKVEAVRDDVGSLEQMGRTALAGLEGTDIGTLISLFADAKDPLMFFVSALVEVVKQSKTFQTALNFVHVAFKAFADAIDTMVGWLFPASSKMQDNQKALDDAFTSLVKSINEVINGIQQSIDQTLSSIKDALSSKITSLKDLYEVGAISATDYAARSKAANKETYDAILAVAKDAGKTDAEATAMASGVTGSLYDITGGHTLADLYERLGQQLTLMGSTSAILEQIGTLQELAGSYSNKDKFEVLQEEIKAAIAASKFDDATKTSLTDKLNAVTLAAAPIVQDTTALAVPVVATAALAAVAVTAVPIATLIASVAAGTAVAAIATAAAPVIAAVAAAAAIGTGTYALGQYLGWWDVGSPNIPQDQFGMVHKGEGIIPATFMDGIRRGDLSLSGGGNNGGSVNVVVNVQGSVQTEKNLATSIATEIYRQRRSGLLTV